MKNTLPDSTALIIEDVVTATLLTNLQALLQYGCTFRPTMFLRKTNWEFIAKALDLQSANRLNKAALLQAIEEEGEVRNPGEAYEKLLLALKGDHEFDRVYPIWLDGARKRFINRMEAESPMEMIPDYYGMATHRVGLYHEAAKLGGMDINFHLSKAV